MLDIFFNSQGYFHVFAEKNGRKFKITIIRGNSFKVVGSFVEELPTQKGNFSCFLISRILLFCIPTKIELCPSECPVKSWVSFAFLLFCFLRSVPTFQPFPSNWKFSLSVCLFLFLDSRPGFLYKIFHSDENRMIFIQR